MTYLVGLRYGSVSTILCDSVVSSATSREVISDTFLKSGSIAPGIIYAICGDVEPAQQFVISAKDYLTGLPISADFWHYFSIFAHEQLSNKLLDGNFQLLLSERFSGTPRFHLFNSLTGIAENIEPPITLGSGRKLLDEVVNEAWGANIHENLLHHSSLEAIHFPYLYALILMERSQGHEASELQSAGVGGYFHFAFQTENYESRQSPAVYALADYDFQNKQVMAWAYRVSFCGPALVVECPIKNQRIIQLESSSWPKCVDLTGEEINDIHKLINAEVEAQPFYNVCGIGVANPALRGARCLDYRSSSGYLIDRQGLLTQRCEHILKNIIANGMNS